VGLWVRVKGNGNTHRVMVGKHQGDILLQDLRVDLENNIKKDFLQI
jgi:hypothetical protein